jgi:acetyl-CoA acetyltransferase
VDSAAALVLASEDRARNHPNPVWIAGAGHCVEEHFLGERALGRSRALEEAAARAYRMAGLRPRDLDAAELHAEFSYQVPLWSEALGLDGGRTSVDPSGGSLAGHAPFVGGLARAAEAVLQLRGEAGPVQVRGAEVALAHGAAGPCGQSQGVAIFRR